MVEDETDRLLDAARESGVLIRLVGGLAVHRHAGGRLHPSLVREYRDIDLVTTGNEARNTGRFLEMMGYEANRRFNSMNAGSRLVFYDVAHERQIDVFVDGFEMCHKVPISNRITTDSETVPLAELLVTKLQIVHLTEKDLKDIWAIVYHHEVADHDKDAINVALVASLLAGDWGLWRTSRQTIQTCRERLTASGLSPTDRGVIDDRLQAIWAHVEAHPKSLAWRLRARVGDRVKWYEDPEEIAHNIEGATS
jgi:hypothetical protein